MPGGGEMRLDGALADLHGKCDVGDTQVGDVVQTHGGALLRGQLLDRRGDVEAVAIKGGGDARCRGSDEISASQCE